MLTAAGQPEILRAAQRDESFQKQLFEKVTEILQSVGGVHFWIKYKKEIEIMCNISYYLMTTMCNLQTLGEEYTGMVQVDSSKKSLPKKYVQMLMILMKYGGENILIKSLQRFEKNIDNLPEEHPLLQSARVELIKMSQVLRTCLPIFGKLHKAIFYLNGDYYEVAKRICGIKYVLIRYWLKDRSSLPAFRVLGIISLFHLFLNLFFTILHYKSIDLEKEIVSRTHSENLDTCDKCSLCLNVRQHTSVTPCGHLFCWSCIISWLQEQPKCPLCRQVFQPSRVVFLQNYSSAS